MWLETQELHSGVWSGKWGVFIPRERVVLPAACLPSELMDPGPGLRRGEGLRDPLLLGAKARLSRGPD